MMHGIFSTSVDAYLTKGCSYILDNFTREHAISLYNIFENTIFHQTVINPEFASDVESLQTVFSFASAAWVFYDIYTVVKHLTNEGSFAQYQHALSVITGVGVITYIANKIFNWWYPPKEDCQKTLTVEIPERIRGKIKASLIRPTTELKMLYLARIFLNAFLAYATPHTIPCSINVLCQIHTLSTVAVKTQWLKFSRTFFYLTKEECVQRLAKLPPFQKQIGNLHLPADSCEIPEEIFEEFLNQLSQIQVSNPSSTFNFQGVAQDEYA
jgi:hypothetical protein